MFLTNLSVAWNGTTWFLAWKDEGIPKPGLAGPSYIDPPPPVIRGARLSAGLVPLDTKPITITAPLYTNLLSPRVASDGRDFLVAWSENPSYSDQPPTITIRRVLATGTLAGNETLLFPGMAQDLVWDGRSYNVAFQSASNPSDLAVARLLPSGQPFDTLEISTIGGSVSLLPLDNGHVLAAYTRVAVEPVYSGAERAFVGVPQRLRGHAVRSH